MERIKSKLFSIINHLAAVLSASFQSVKYGHLLGIKKSEWKRYLEKSIGLALCYAAFAELGKIKEGWMAGKAAFLCCAYDIVTDWRGFDSKSRLIFEKVLHSIGVSDELQKSTMNLYEREIFQQLEDDGLDRGAIALRFILKLMGCENTREVIWKNLDEIGRLLQIVDDVLDYEHDVKYGDINCLTTENRDIYLKQLLNKFEDAEVRKLFGNESYVLRKVIEKARGKAEKLLQMKIIEKVIIESECY